MSMTATDILTDMVLVETEKTATIHAPVERVDIVDWLRQLSMHKVSNGRLWPAIQLELHTQKYF